MQTVASRFDPRNNSLNFLRLVFALAVIVSHTWPLGGYGPDPTFAHQNLGIWAVIGFFAISGYLIAASRLHTSMTAFLLRRVLRIYPGYLVCLVVVALGFAPLSQALGTGSVQWSSSATYMLHNVLLKVSQENIQHTLTGAPYGTSWNGSLWTLIYEFLCYLAIGALLSITRRWRRPLVVAAFVALAALATLEQHVGNEGSLWAFAFLGSVFFAGSLIAVFAARIPLDWRLALVAIVLAVVGGEVQQVTWIAAFPAAYACMWLGTALPFQHIGRRNDISYGVYIYAFPVQQIVLVCLGARHLPVGAAVMLSVVATLPFAAASWFLVEHRALALKRRTGVESSIGVAKPVAKHAAPGSTRLSPVLQPTDSA